MCATDVTQDRSKRTPSFLLFSEGRERANAITKRTHPSTKANIKKGWSGSHVNLLSQSTDLKSFFFCLERNVYSTSINIAINARGIYTSNMVGDRRSALIVYGHPSVSYRFLSSKQGGRSTKLYLCSVPIVITGERKSRAECQKPFIILYIIKVSF